ncbi:isoleucine--tRNA ligase [Endogone sp. FLAS-F59071]|nr:isoleucine--tRNA ligase [Endogone sp. FLAS-F59071]|eukprot:RUS15214.1 isoleucine--tRNA ligase [Endogone sp. FLAS-F59071]
MVKKGYIYRQLKPVYWSPSSRTALAEAELEYKDDHESRSIYVKFPVVELAPALATLLPKDVAPTSVHTLIWTTTPWTIPANKAVAVNPDMTYILVRSADGSHLIVAKERLTPLREELGTKAEPVELTEVLEIAGPGLIGMKYSHPLTGEILSVISGDHVTAESGTGLVHTAPGHGMEDYEACRPLGIKPFSPVDDIGHFTAEAGADLAGKFVFTDGNTLVIEQLTKNGYLVREKKYKHKYPYDWRTKKPVMLRATAQWFANVEELQQRAVEQLKTVRMVPEASFRRIEQFTLSRKEWCISRQRSWGVPIPVLYDTETGQPLLTDNSVRHIVSIIEQTGGTDAWWEIEDDAVFVADEYKTSGKTYRRGYDTMDVWFDSGSSWTFARDQTVKERGSDKPVADVYLEGSDQHRGWFQSSLLTSIAVTGKSPYSTLITHGFVLDENGRKMSKSIGNVIEPKFITHGGKDVKQFPAYGTDIMRLWVGSSEYTRDVTVGKTILAGVAESMRKIRTTARFMLGNLDGFMEAQAMKYEDLKEIDKYMLYELYQFNKRVTEAYEEFSFNKVAQAFHSFNNNTLSAFYFDVVKDRLYNDAEQGAGRRNAQTVLFRILNDYTITLAPIACHTAEEIYEHFKDVTLAPKQSVFRVGWPRLIEEWNDANLKQEWDILKLLKAEVNQVLEFARQDKAIRGSQEATVEIHIDPKSSVAALLRKHGESELAGLFITSDAKIVDKDAETFVAVAGEIADTTQVSQAGSYEKTVTFEAESEQVSKCRVVVRAIGLLKCARCWNYTETVEGGLCERCEDIVRVAA